VKDNRAFAAETMAVLPKDWSTKRKIPTQGFAPEIETIENLVDIMGKVQIVVFSSNVFVNILT